jgi:GNAT superfamily N-acetyltransferase
MNHGSSTEYRTEVLTDAHDRASFQCGTPELDRYFRLQAGQDVRRRVASCYVLVHHERGLAGFYTISAYGIQINEVPPQFAKKLPHYRMLPVTLIGRLAVSTSFQGHGVGRILLLDALERSWKAALEVASIGVMVEALDEKARQFYLRNDFRQIPDQPYRLFLDMKAIEKMFK